MPPDRPGPDSQARSERWPSFRLEDVLGPPNEFERRSAPGRLFYIGNVGLLRIEPRVSLVGSRSASEEGLTRARELASVLAEQGVPVVSGLALGIDTAAHRAAMDAGGSTIAVLGTPIDRVYPPQNAALQQEIAEKYLVLSQFPPGGRTTKATFPRRNRTMALISHASIIVEAGEGSGTLHQGWEALRLGRLLFIARSLFDRPGLAWPHEMLKYGARVLSNPTDLLNELPLPAGEALADVAF